jgi:hypothetical protein
MTDRYVAPAAGKREAIRAIYAAIDAPDWAAPNLDGLIDVLRDLSWLPPGPVVLRLPAGDLPEDVVDALAIAQEETAGSDRPVRVGRYPSQGRL